MRRNEIDAGSQPVRNLFTNPAFETTSGSKDVTIRTNYLMNPSMSASSSSASNMRTNLVTNPSMEGSSANVAVRTNLAPNPGMEASSGTTNVRTNFVTSARGVSALSPYSGVAGTQTPNVPITGHPENITTAVRVTYTTQANVGVSLLDVAEFGATYSMSVWVYHESILSTPGLQAFAQAGVQSSSGTIPEVGKWTKLSWTWTATASSNIGFRVSGNSGTGSGSMLLTGMIIEKAMVPGPFFDGATTTLNLAKNPSFEVNTDQWGSQWYGNGGGAGTFTRSAGTGISGGASGRKLWTTANPTNAVDVGITTTISVTPGATYTGSIYQRCSISNSMSSWIIWKDSSNAIISTTPKYTVATPAGAWVRGSVTEVAPANAATGTFIFGPQVNAVPMPQGAYIDWDWAMIEESDKLNPYYDGTAAAPADFTYAWTGSVNNSTSVQRAPNATNYNTNTASAKVWQTGTISHNGTKALAVESVSTASFSNGFNFGITNLPIGSYVFSIYVYLPAAYGATGIAACSFGSGTTVLRGNQITATGSWQRTSVKFTVSTLGTTYLYVITDGATPAPIGARFYADSAMIEAANDMSPYFDAANPRTNLLANPSFEINTTGWGGAGAPVATYFKDSTTVFSGTSSLKVVCDGSTGSQGIFTSTKTALKPNRYYTASIWVKADVGKPMRIDLGEWDDGTNLVGSRTVGPTVNGTGDWMRLSVTRLMGPYAAFADIVVRNINAVAHTFWADAAMLEESDTLNDYYEGTGPFTYAWTGTANASSTEQRAPAVAGITWQGAIAPYQSTSKAFIGTKSLYVEGSASDVMYGVHAGPTVSGLTTGLTYTLSAWVFIMPGSVGLELQPSGVGSVTSGRTAFTGKWERIYQTFVAASSSHMLRLRTTSNGKVSAFVDAMVLEQGGMYLPYFDGTNPAYQNLCVNPSFSANILNYTSVSASLTRNTSLADGAVLEVTQTTDGSARQGAIYISPEYLKSGTYTVSFYASATATELATVRVMLYNTTRAVTVHEAAITTLPLDKSGSFTRYSFTVTATDTFDKVYFDFLGTSIPVNTKAWIDRVLIELSPTASNYFEGTGDYNYIWGGAADASFSIQRYYPTMGQYNNKSASDPNSRFWGMQSTDETGKPMVKWIAPAGTPSSGWRVAGIGNMDYANIQSGKSYTLYLKYRTRGWAPSAMAPVQISDSGSQNQVMGTHNSYRLDLNAPNWTIYRRTFTAALTATSGTILYLNLPVTPEATTDGILEISEAFLVDNSHSGEFFDGSTVSTDPDIAYAWNGTPNASTSKMTGTSITGTGNVHTHGSAFSSTEWKSSGSKSLRLLAKNNASNDSFVEIKNMMANGGVLKPYTKYTLAGTRYLKAPLTGTLNIGTPGFRVSGGGERPVTYKPGYGVVNTAGANRVIANFTTNDTAAMAFIRLQQGSMEGNGDVWWDDIMLVEGDYIGPHVDGTLPNAKWDGTAHASTSVGYPTTLESLVGMPLFTNTSAGGTTALNPADISTTEPRTFYSVVDAPVDVATGNIDVIWTYGNTGFGDAPANANITFRFQSEAGPVNAILARRTGGAGAIKSAVPVPGRYVLFCGLDETGRMFTGHGGNQAPTVDNFSMQVAHESFQVYANNQHHTHIVTYMYRGLHDATTRAQVIKLLAQRHNVPLLV